jgi:predicted O-methyltransferase YrrM
MVKIMWNIIHDKNPYDGFEIDESSVYIPIQHNIFYKIITEFKPQTCLEVGSWRGASAIHIAELLDTHVYNPLLICVDTWLGSPEHLHMTGVSKKYAEAWGYKNLRHKHGYPSLYNTFMSNVLEADMQHIIVPFPQTSSNAFIFFRRNNIKFDFIYLDGAHDYKSVVRDLLDCNESLNDGGIILCDDYNLDSVYAAVHDVYFTKEMCKIDATKCVIKK